MLVWLAGARLHAGRSADPFDGAAAARLVAVLRGARGKKSCGAQGTPAARHSGHLQPSCHAWRQEHMSLSHRPAAVLPECLRPGGIEYTRAFRYSRAAAMASKSAPTTVVRAGMVSWGSPVGLQSHTASRDAARVGAPVVLAPHFFRHLRFRAQDRRT